MSLKPHTQQLLEKSGIAPNKVLGQNFLVDERKIDKIIDAADLVKEDVVIEVGAGTGSITQELAKRAKKVIAVEKDKKLIPILQEELKNFKNVEILNQDVLKLKIENSNYKVVGSVPYYLTARLFRYFLEDVKNPPKTIVVGIQKEVAQKIAARPSKSNLLAVSVQLYGEVKILESIPRGAYWPQPDVDSVILKIQNIQKPVVDEKRFFRIVRAGFSSPRKQLAVNLYRELKIPKDKTEKTLNKEGIDPKIRAGALSIEQWKKLSKTLDF